jgi:hypothetical protein
LQGESAIGIGIVVWTDVMFWKKDHIINEGVFFEVTGEDTEVTKESPRGFRVRGEDKDGSISASAHIRDRGREQASAGSDPVLGVFG